MKDTRYRAMQELAQKLFDDGSYIQDDIIDSLVKAMAPRCVATEIVGDLFKRGYIQQKGIARSERRAVPKEPKGTFGKGIIRTKYKSEVRGVGPWYKKKDSWYRDAIMGRYEYALHATKGWRRNLMVGVPA